VTESDIECPFCHAHEAEMLSLFGQQLMTVQYYCRACRTPFERVKGEDVLEDARRRVRDESERQRGSPS
jgi:ring-1,2-phenylacetyl-CoA epoxidase subunit PaaD